MNPIKLCIAAALCVAPATAQELPPGPLGPSEDPRQRMLELFQKVELRLAEIDKLLYDAGTGNAPLGRLEESGIAELLKRSRQKGEEVKSGIDEILEIAAQNGGT